VTVSVYFHSYAQPFPELEATGLTLPRDVVSQQNSSVQGSWTRSSGPWMSMVVKNVCLQKPFCKKEKQRNRCFSPTNFFSKSPFFLQKQQHLPIRDYIVIWEVFIWSLRVRLRKWRYTVLMLAQPLQKYQSILLIRWQQTRSCKWPNKCWEHIIEIFIVYPDVLSVFQ